MRQILVGHIAGQRGNLAEGLVEVSLSSLTAQPLADAFFGVCRAVSGLDDDEHKIETRLRKQVSEEITRRNDIAHGDWLIASWTRPDAIPPTPTLVRTKASKIDEPFRSDEYTVERIDAICTEVEGTGNAVWEFGTVCTKQDAYDPRRGHPETRVRQGQPCLPRTAVGSSGSRQHPCRVGQAEQSRRSPPLGCEPREEQRFEHRQDDQPGDEYH